MADGPVCFTIYLQEPAAAERDAAVRRGYEVTVKKKQVVVTTLLVAATATFVYALLKRQQGQKSLSPIYARPKGGERDGEELLFIGS